MKRSTVALYNTRLGHYAPPVYLPTEYVMRITNKKQFVTTPPTDPKFGWHSTINELNKIVPAFSSKRGVNGFAGGNTRSEVPPVPVYRKSIWCMGHAGTSTGHPRIFIKSPPMKVVACKWCGLKFINMSAEGDCDDDWIDVEHKIATTPEKMEDIKEEARDATGVVQRWQFMDDVEPDPHVYRASLNPEKHRWDHKDYNTYDVHPRYAKK